MSRFDMIRDAAGDPQLEPILADMTAQLDDRPLNWFTSHAARPDILGPTWSLFKALLLQGRVPSTLKQMICMTISVHHHCRYCAVTHTNALEAMGVPEEVIKCAVSDPDMRALPGPSRTVLQFALKAAREPGSITDADYSTLLAAGFTREEVIEIVMVVAWNAFANIWADTSAIPLDTES
jgi:uncharacterized peroxidase-related enzyme